MRIDKRFKIRSRESNSRRLERTKTNELRMQSRGKK